MAWPVSGLLLLCLAHVRTVAAELEPAATAAYDRYVADATKVFLEQRTPHGQRSPRDGEVIVRPARQDGIVSVPGGLVHHWTGATFIDHATIADTLAISYAYENYHAVYGPVVSSRLLGREGDTYHVQLRIKEGAAGVSAVLQVKSTVKYFFPSGSTAYSISIADEIREVKNAGETTEQLLPAGKGSGYLWRAATLSRVIERDGGVAVEMETIGLSRAFPLMLAWIIEPIARRLGRKSVELSLQEFATADRTRKAG